MTVRSSIAALRHGRTKGVVGVACAAVLVAGCGDNKDYANKPRPPAPITVTAAITKHSVKVDPAKFGAGPVVLLISNQTADSQEITLETADTSSGPGVTKKTDPINPSGTGEIKVDLEEGDYTLSTGDSDIRAAPITVGAERKSAQNDLLQP